MYPILFIVAYFHVFISDSIVRALYVMFHKNVNHLLVPFNLEPMYCVERRWELVLLTVQD